MGSSHYAWAAVITWAAQAVRLMGRGWQAFGRWRVSRREKITNIEEHG